MKNVIVTGANGFIGNSLIKKLIENNVKVVAVDISFAAPRLPETDLITKIEATVDASLADKIPAGEYDAFYHLAWRGVNGAEKADPTIQLANIQMAIDCAKLLQKSEMRKNMVMDLIYRGFIYAANYSESHYNPRRSQIKTELRYLFVTTPNR